MADTVRSVEYYYVTIPDTPGEGQRILSAFKESGVNLLAFLGFPLGWRTVADRSCPGRPRVTQTGRRAGRYHAQ